MDRAYVAAIVAEYLDEQEPVDTYPSEGGFDFCSSQDLAEEGVKDGYFTAFYDDKEFKLEQIGKYAWANFGNIKLKPTALAFFYVLGPR